MTNPRSADPLLISIGYWLANDLNERIDNGWGVFEVSGLLNRGDSSLTAENLQGRINAFALYGGLLGVK